jgi:hypothetical protein
MRPLVFSFKTLPCVIWRGEEDFGPRSMGNVLLHRELLSVVEGDGVHEVADRLEATHGCSVLLGQSRAAT